MLLKIPFLTKFIENLSLPWAFIVKQILQHIFMFLIKVCAILYDMSKTINSDEILRLVTLASSRTMLYKINGELWTFGFGKFNCLPPRRVNVNRSSLRSAVRLSKSARLFDAVPELGVLCRLCLSNAFCRNAPAYCASSLKRKFHRSICRYLLDRSLNEISEPFRWQNLRSFESR